LLDFVIRVMSIFKITFLLMMLFCTSVFAESVHVLGISGKRVSVEINNSAVVVMVPGAEVEGVRLLGVAGDVARFSILGDAYEIINGQSMVIASSTFSTMRDPESHGIVIRKGDSGKERKEFLIKSDTQGSYFTVGTINGFPVRFQVDTGAGVVAMSRATGERIGLPVDKGLLGKSFTASGVADMRFGLCREVTVGPIKLEKVVCGVNSKADNGALNQVTLLGNSFLRRLKWRQEEGVLILIQDI
jgi:clan AA aspartic protease (TIGR02281 family)